MMMAAQLPLQFEFKPDYTFDNFLAANNQEIIAHLQRSIAGKGETQIFIWGAQGEGKTHLLQACCQLAQQQQQRAFYMPLQINNLPAPEILDGLEHVPILCIDNIEQIAGHKIWENALFNFYNRHKDSGHSLILASRMSPSSLSIKLPDLKTRLNWGLTLKLQQLDDEDKIAVVIAKAKQQGLDVSPQIGRFLLNHCARDLHSLWQVLEIIDHATLAAKRKLSIPFLKKILDQSHEH
jgi:DnaA family protein